MTKDFKKFLTESELKLEPKMRVGDTLRLNINAKQIVEMTITDISNGKITVESSKPDYLDFDKDGDEKESMKKALQDKEEKVDEVITGKPEHKHVGGAGMGGGYSATEDEATTQHQLGSHKYIAKTEVDDDGDQYYTIMKIVDGKPVEIYNQMQDMDPSKNVEPMVTKKILSDHMKETAHMFNDDLEDMDYGSQIDEILKLSGVTPVKADEAITGKPEHKHVGGAGMGGGYSATEDEATTQHQLGSHKYIAKTEVDDDGDQYYTIMKIVDGKPVEIYNQMQDEDPSKNVEPMVAKKILSDHMKETAHMFNDEEMYEHKGLLATILKNAGLKTVTESDLNNKTAGKNQIDEISAGLVSRAAKQAEKNAYDADRIGAYKAQRIHNDQADRLYTQAEKKKKKEEEESAKAHELRGLSGVKRRALNKMFYNAEGASKKNTFQMSEGKIVVDNQLFDLTLNNARRTWTANVWTSKKVF